MSAGDILILLILAGVIAAIVRVLVRKKKTGCSGDCGSCGDPNVVDADYTVVDDDK